MDHWLHMIPLVQECPSIFVPLAISAWSICMSKGLRPSVPQKGARAMFLLHYFWRSLVYPFLLKGQKGTPWPVASLAFIFCCCNDVQQVRVGSGETSMCVTS